MKSMAKSLLKTIKSTKIVAGFAVITAVAAIGTSSVAAAAPSYFNVPKPTSQKICYAKYGEGWQAAGFKNLDHCLRYVSTKAPAAKADCNHGYWYVWGFNSWDQCASWVVLHGGSGYAGDPSERF
ncbi:MAG TPA: hypothetical protein VLG11_04805 [Candidatus Saccharimonadales bacterium]|nr:hypothetical protein [Candidatus Saccharimonadales bacterium]